MTAEPTTETTTITRYAVLERGDDIDWAADCHLHETRKAADEARRYFDCCNKHGSPHRIVRLDITITEEATA